MIKKEKNEKPFVKIHTDGALSGNEIWIDTETGVNYFFHASGYAGGLTPLLDSNGKPIITPMDEE